MTTYSYSTNGEYFTGDYASAELAAEDAFNESPDITSVEVGRNIKQTAHTFVNAQHILEVISDSACDEGPEHAYDWLHCNLMENKEKCAELEKLIGDWVERNEPVNFFTVDDIVAFERGFSEELPTMTI